MPDVPPYGPPGPPDPLLPGAVPGGPGVPDLVVRGLRKTYGAPPVRALRGVDLTVRAGEFVALMGPSGSGKSTLLHLVAGLDRADEGTIALAGVRIEELGGARLARLRRRHVGLVFQFFHLIEHLSALENVALAALIAGLRPAAATARARDLLDTLGLLDRAAERPAALSGGQRQRVAIARALANRPTLLLADEPTGALDSAGAAEVLDLFGRLHRTGQTILVVTHSREVAAGAQRVVRMHDGQVVDDGTGPREAPRDPRAAVTVPVRTDALTGRRPPPSGGDPVPPWGGTDPGLPWGGRNQGGGEPGGGQPPPSRGWVS